MRKLKITREQHNLLVSKGLIKESDDTKKDKKDDNKKETGDVIKDETTKLLAYLYGRKTDDFSEFWSEHDLSYDDICDALKSKKLIVKKQGRYVIPKSYGAPDEAILAIEDTLRALTGITKPELEEDYPAGAEHDSQAPYNQPDNEDEPIRNHTDYTLIVYNQELIIFKDKFENKFYMLDLINDFIDYEGEKLQDEDIFNYLNNNEGELRNKLIPLDIEMIDELFEMYDLNNFFMEKLANIKKQISGVNEGNSEWPDTYRDLEPKKRTGPENQAILDKVRGLKQQSDITHPKPVTKHPLDPHPDDIEETMTASASGAFIAPMGGPIKKGMCEGNTVASVGGQYDTPGLANVGRNGEYKKGPKTNAQVKTQYPDGGFVEIDDCTKLNNNKTSQGGGCSQGAKDNVVTQKKSKGSVISPSLSESKIFETIAKQTGKTIEEVQAIIKNKK